MDSLWLLLLWNKTLPYLKNNYEISCMKYIAIVFGKFILNGLQESTWEEQVNSSAMHMCMYELLSASWFLFFSSCFLRNVWLKNGSQTPQNSCGEPLDYSQEFPDSWTFPLEESHYQPHTTRTGGHRPSVKYLERH